MTPINLADALQQIEAAWTPRRLGSVNDTDVKVARLEGDFVWHSHPDSDELFLVLEGTMTMALPDREVTMGPGDLLIVPRGVRHCPKAPGGCSVLLVEARGTLNTGDAPESDLTHGNVEDIDQR